MNIDIINIVLLVAFLVYIGFGLLIFIKGREKKSSLAYAAVILVTVCWTWAMIMYRSASPEQSLIWCRLLYVTATFMSSSFFIFSVIFPYEIMDRNKIGVAILLNILVVTLLVVPDLVIVDVKDNPAGEKIIIWGKYYFLYFAFISGLIAAGLFILLKKYLKESGIVKMQLKYIFFGYLIGTSFAMATNLILPWMGYFSLNWAGQVLVMFTVMFTVYAIIKHRLMDIKMVLRSSSVYLSSLLMVLLLAVGANTVFYNYFPTYIYWTNLLVLVFATSFFATIKNRFFRLANKYFFSSLYDPQKLIAGLSDKLRTTLDIDTIYNYLFELLDDAFHFKNFAVLSYSETSNSYYVEFNKGFDVDRKKVFQGSVILHSELIGKNKIIFTDEVKSDYYNQETKEVIDLLVNLNIEVLIPLNVKNKTVGLIALGKKESGDIYTEGDLQILEIVGAQAATVIENAYLYEKTLNFNLKLKDEVEKATRELVAANKKLIKLDEAKSEFISIASHQLRTPLTIIKGYISMILEGNFGELTPGEKDSLDKVYLSNERLIQLVENLLNISRIESGRLQFDYKEMQLSDIIDSVVEELEPKAKGKGLKFTYKKSKKKMPNINIDEEKIRQVVMNLVDNAIKYTKKGSVTVSLDMVKPRDPKIPVCLEFKVADSGMGISADDLPNLFKKFSRGTGSSLVHTEGTGLGLYVARQMIEAHHGKIWAESIGENKGSKFCFRISLDNPEKKVLVDKKVEKKGKKKDRA